MPYSGNRSLVATCVPVILKNDVLPGGEKATHTLVYGTVVELEDLADGTFREEIEIRVSKVGGQIVNKLGKSAENAVNIYNTIHTRVW